MKIMKQRKTSGQKTRFAAPGREIIRSWTQFLSGTRHSFHSLALAEQPKPSRHRKD
jgi:hypothetical protein